MLALSVSISTSSSPRLTLSPSDLSHLRIVPSSIESDRRGMVTSAMAAEYMRSRPWVDQGAAVARRARYRSRWVGAVGSAALCCSTNVNGGWVGERGHAQRASRRVRTVETHVLHVRDEVRADRRPRGVELHVVRGGPPGPRPQCLPLTYGRVEEARALRRSPRVRPSRRPRAPRAARNGTPSRRPRAR